MKYLVYLIITGLLITSISSFGQNAKSKEKARIAYYSAKKEYSAGNIKKATKHIESAIKNDNCLEYREFKQKITSSNAGLASELTRMISNTEKKYKKQDFHGAYLILKEALEAGEKAFFKESHLMSCLHSNYGVACIFHQGISKRDGKKFIIISKKDLQNAKEQFDFALSYNPENYIAKLNSAYIRYILKDSTSNKTGRKIVLPKNYLEEEGLDKHAGSSVNRNSNLPDRVDIIVESLFDYDEILLVADISGSMKELQPGFNNSRIEIMKGILTYLLGTKGFPVTCNLGLLTIEDCSIPPLYSYATTKTPRDSISNKIPKFKPMGSTPLNDRLIFSEKLFSNKNKNKKAILLMSDGMNTCGSKYTCDITKNLYNKGIDIFVLTFLLANKNIKAFSMYDCIAEKGSIWAIDESQQIVYVENNIWPIYQFLIPTEIRPEGKFSCAIDLPCRPEINKDNPYYVKMKE
ncbi:MAG: VWA domain-containing protein [Bacteroidales bacterium]|nr:VWA domain-containing protein [Bacteroidales bacterium]MCF8457981.1 VWA domain-containing protein [Bacteroidales bacterium]